jgi:DNA polymerase-3 subunit gamma/tau
MAYVALYRKYRSQSFDELQGQEAVTTTLRNSIAAGRFGHAYLFHGARGCGKTSTARLLARALNCVAQDGPTPNPCGQCRLCVAIRNGSCLDVVEMDAASETGIDDVREKVIESVQYAPGEGRFKVYIIDEVHDLSSKAFDALLKTLEEPPPHVVFVLATTEYHKVPITIRSRCMGFQFKRGTIQDLSKSIERVVTSEGYRADSEAIQAIARSAEGSWRDALSILEQVLAYSDGHVTAETVHRAVGTVGVQTLARVTDILATGAMNNVFDIAAELLDSGADVRQLLTAMQGHLRDLTLLAAGAKQAAQELGPDRLALLEPQASLLSPQVLLQMQTELASAEREVRFSNQHRWILERTLARAQAIAQGTEQRNAAANGRPALISTPQQPASPVREAPSAPPLAATPAAVPKPPVSHAAPPSRYASPVDEEETEEPDDAEIEQTEETALPAIAQSTYETPPAVLPVAESAAPVSPSAEAAPSNAHRFADEVTLTVIQRAWPRILKIVEQVSKPAIGFLEKADVCALEGQTVVLRFQQSYARDRIHNKGRDLVEKALNKGLKTEGYKIRCVLEGQEDSGGPPGSIPARAPNGPAPTDGGGSTLEMGALLEGSIVNTPVQPTRLMDFDRPAPTPPPAQNGAQPSSAASGAEGQKRTGTGLVADVINVFGGQVVKPEKA